MPTPRSSSTFHHRSSSTFRRRSSSTFSYAELNNPYYINEETLIKKVNRGRRGTLRPQIFLAIAVSLASMSTGLVLAWSNAILRNSQDDMVPIDPERYSWVCSLAPIGCMVGVIPCFYLSYRFGPRKCILTFLAPILFATWIVLAFDENREHGNRVVVCRLFAGFSCCGITICSDQWLTDSVHPENLKNLLLMTKFSFLFGFLVSGIVDRYLYMRDLCFICASIVALQFFLMCFLPESPVHLCESNEKKSQKSLAWYLGEPEAYDEIRCIRKNAYARKQLIEFDQFLLTNQTVYKPLLIVLTLKAFQCFSGYYTILFYYVYLWAQHRPVIDKDSDIIFFLIFMMFNRLVAASVYYANPIGTRLPVLLSFAMLVVTYLCLWLYQMLYIKLLKYELVSLLDWLSMPMWNWVVISYEMGLSIYPEVILRDYLPIQVRMQARCYLYFIHWLFIFIITKVFITFLDWLDEYVYLCYASIAALGFIFSYKFVVNSKGLSLVQVQILFGGNPIGSRGASRERKQYADKPEQV